MDASKDVGSGFQMDFYYLAGEYMDCNHCSGTYMAWDDRMLEQLPSGVRANFPAVLTQMYATLFRARILGSIAEQLNGGTQ